MSVGNKKLRKNVYMLHETNHPTPSWQRKIYRFLCSMWKRRQSFLCLQKVGLFSSLNEFESPIHQVKEAKFVNSLHLLQLSICLPFLSTLLSLLLWGNPHLEAFENKGFYFYLLGSFNLSNASHATPQIPCIFNLRFNFTCISPSFFHTLIS